MVIASPIRAATDLKGERRTIEPYSFREGTMIPMIWRKGVRWPRFPSCVMEQHERLQLDPPFRSDRASALAFCAAARASSAYVTNSFTSASNASITSSIVLEQPRCTASNTAGVVWSVSAGLFRQLCIDFFTIPRTQDIVSISGISATRKANAKPLMLAGGSSHSFENSIRAEENMTNCSSTERCLVIPLQH